MTTKELVQSAVTLKSAYAIAKAQPFKWAAKVVRRVWLQAHPAKVQAEVAKRFVPVPVAFHPASVRVVVDETLSGIALDIHTALRGKFGAVTYYARIDGQSCTLTQAQYSRLSMGASVAVWFGTPARKHAVVMR